MKRLAEDFSSIKAKMNSNVSVAISGMNDSLVQMCENKEGIYKPKDIMKVSQDYLALYLRLENEIQKEKEFQENMKHRKLNTKIKEHEVALIENPKGLPTDLALSQSRFSPTMTPS